jgi:uncharacterized protein YfbU (UPF0304 family)
MSQEVYRTFTEPSQNLHRTFTEPSQNLHRTFTEPSQNLHRTFTEILKVFERLPKSFSNLKPSKISM